MEREIEKECERREASREGKDKQDETEICEGIWEVEGEEVESGDRGRLKRVWKGNGKEKQETEGREGGWHKEGETERSTKHCMREVNGGGSRR